VSDSGQSRPSLRAKDSDREAVIEALAGAFVEGQLDPVEHQRRVDVALAAPTVGSLSMLTVDLQLSQQTLYDLSARGIVTLVPVTTPEPKMKLVWDKRRLAILAIVLLGLGGCLGITTAISQQDSDSRFGAGPPIMRAQPVASVINKPYLDRFVRAYEAKFHNTLVVSVVTDAQGLRVVVPAVGSATRSSVYSYDGVRFAKESGTSPSTQAVDLADLDTARTSAVVNRAADELGVQDPRQVDVLIGQTAHGPGVRVTVHQSGGGTSTMTTDLRGRVTSTSP
jgi:hypothetical protein